MKHFSLSFCFNLTLVPVPLSLVPPTPTLVPPTPTFVPITCLLSLQQGKRSMMKLQIPLSVAFLSEEFCRRKQGIKYGSYSYVNNLFNNNKCCLFFLLYGFIEKHINRRTKNYFFSLLYFAFLLILSLLNGTKKTLVLLVQISFMVIA